MDMRTLQVGTILEQIKVGNYNVGYFENHIKGRNFTIMSVFDEGVTFETNEDEPSIGFGIFTFDYLNENFRIVSNVRQVVEINLGENDLDDFREMIEKNETMTWCFEDQFGVTVDLVFMNDDEFQQRRK